MGKTGPEFLHEQNPQFHKTPQVNDTVNYLWTGGERFPNSPPHRIAAYLGFLANELYVHDGILRPNLISGYAQAEAAITQAKEIPRSYFDRRRQYMRQEGYGNNGLDYELRANIIETLQEDQRYTLRAWVTHLGEFPFEDWFKYLAWNTIIRLTREPKPNDTFRRRSKGTLLPHPDFNARALVYTYQIFQDILQGKTDNFRDKETAAVAATQDFNAIYFYALKKAGNISPEVYKETKGKWRIFAQSDSLSAAAMLARTLQGYSTGWCTASEKTAGTQLSEGPFYVYFTPNTSGELTIPRVAIRTNEGRVEEVRGIAPHQQIEENLWPIVLEHLKNIPGAQAWMEKTRDMKRMTELERRIADDPQAPLSVKDTLFLYEIYRRVWGFAGPDPRVRELQAARGEADVNTLRAILPETIHSQLRQSYISYRKVLQEVHQNLPMSALKERILSPDDFKDLYAQQVSKWEENGVFDFVARQFVVAKAHFALVATPNIPISKKHVRDAFLDRRSPGNHMPQTRELTDDRWVGYDPAGAGVRFALISPAPLEHITKGVATMQRKTLAYLKEAYPDFAISLPSVMDAMVFRKLMTAKLGIFDTSIWLFDIPGKTYKIRMETIDLLPAHHQDMPILKIS